MLIKNIPCISRVDVARTLRTHCTRKIILHKLIKEITFKSNYNLYKNYAYLKIIKKSKVALAQQIT